MVVLGQRCYVRLLVVLAAVWLVAVLLATVAPLSGGSADSVSGLVKRLDGAVAELAALRTQNDELRGLLVDFTEVTSNGDGDKKETIERLKRKIAETQGTAAKRKEEPSLEYEQALRQTRRDVDEIWRHLRSQLSAAERDVASRTANSAARLRALKEDMRERYTVLRGDLYNVTGEDGWSAWRRREAELLTDLMRRRILYLQNPADCASAKKLVCSLNKVCGFGCQLHHVAYCLMVAYGTSRTLVLNSRNWRYNRAGWEQVFQPLSDTCTDAGGRSRAAWPGSEDTQVLTLPIIDVVQPRPQYLPLSIPADLASRLLRLHGDPAVWFVAQFVRYLMRPQQHLKTELDDFVKRVQMRNPCVGVHVRRTDKVGTEAAFHSIDEYMQHVEEFYLVREAETGTAADRCVYLASDDPTVIKDAVKKFPKYTFLGDPGVSKTAAVSSRYSDASLRGVIADIHALSLTDHLVCTFSSQVCRVAYELMQTLHVDAADRFTSLDDIYYYGGQSAHEQTARFAHTPADGSQIALLPGDTVGIAGNHWDGFSKGENRRGKKVGLYPAYKARDRARIVQFPTYPEVPLTL